ncbi:MAG: NAD(P)-dependent oxidoreductase [Alphaproteobacteria bacterium]|nr:NAD(P)-dependent oxidoreductase [Alphaproteobacteria bacterium]
MTTERIGFIGLGNMGQPMATNLAAAGFPLVCYDIAGTQGRAPSGAVIAGSVTKIAQSAKTVIISVNTGKAVDDVTREIAAAANRTVTTVVDTSTIGTKTARLAAARLAAVGVDYLDSPVAGASGGTGIGPTAAKAAALTFIVAGKKEAVERVRPVLEKLGRKLFHVGEEPGQAQAVKLINNFLICTAIAATSEAINYGLKQNLAMTMILDVLNVSSGQNVATSYIFPKEVATGTFHIGAAVEIMTKDAGLYFDEVHDANLPNGIGTVVNRIWQNMGKAHPGVDFSHIFEFIRDAGEGYDR